MVLTIPTGLAGEWWPVVVGGLYGMVALVVPSPTKIVDLSDDDVQLQQLHDDLDELDATVNSLRRRLPDDAAERTNAVMALVHEVVRKGEDLSAQPTNLFTVSRTVADYLPSALETYTDLPRRYATKHRGPNGKTPHEELLAQLDLLQSELTKVSNAVHDGNAQQLSNQTRFLRDAFGGSSLDL